LKQVASISKAARLYNIPHQTLSDRIRGRVARIDSRANGHKLTPVEEEVLVQWIISMDERGYPLAIGGLRNAARLLLRERVGLSVTIGINWPSRFIERQPGLKSTYTRNTTTKELGARTQA
jgi:hypothetical protein